MTTKKKYQEIVNNLVIKKYSFITDVEVYRLTPLFFGASVDANFCVKRDFIKNNVNGICVEEIPESEPILLTLFSFNMCSKVKLPTNEINELFERVYKLTINYDKINYFSTNLMVIAPNIDGEF
jgi:hypothetical protein